MNDSRKLEQLKAGLLKYFSRACTRSTPYGYFASIKMGYFSECQNLNVDSNLYYKSVRPDMEWIHKFIKNIEENITILPNLKIKLNQTTYINGDRAYLPYSSNTMTITNVENSKAQLNEDISIKCTSLVQFIFEILKNDMEVNILINKIKEKFKLNEENKIYALLQELIQNGFIITELKPIMGKTDILSSLISKVSLFSSQKSNYEYLVNLSLKINSYLKLKIGEGIEELNDIIVEMQKLYFVKNPLQIDIFQKTKEQITIEHENVFNLKKITNFLLKFSNYYNGFWQIREYHSEFLNKYGFAQEVGIKELLDENMGLGAPANYKFPKSFRKIKNKESQNDMILNYFFDKITQSNFKQSECIQISEQDLKRLDIKEKKLDNIPDTIEIYANIFNDKEANRNKISLSAIQNTFTTCSTFGRFTNLFSEQNKIDISNYIRELEIKYPDTLFCELIFSPTSIRSSNVALTESYWSYRIYLDSFADGDKCNLNLEDIVVCANNKRLYFKSLQYQKEVVFVASHMLNFQNAPNIIRFMREVSYEKEIFWNHFPLSEFSNFTYIPRIEYENIIVTPRTWKLNLLALKEFKIDFEVQKDFTHTFLLWKEAWKVPDFVNAIHSDNKILLDLRKDFHIQELKKDFIRNEKLILQENLEIQFCNLNNEEKIYNHEAVIPFYSIHNKKNNLEILEKCKSNKYSRNFYPGGDWLYCKMYISNTREEEFISNYIYEFINEIKKEMEIETWYFIRYQDPKKHVRFRVLLKDKKDYANLLMKFNYIFEFLAKKGILNSSSIETYEPEIERYGGPDLMPLAEKIFMNDSEIACILIKNKKIIEKDYSLIYICAFLSIEILNDFQLNFEEKLNWVNLISNKDKYIDEFRDKRKLITKLFIDNHFIWHCDKLFKDLSPYITKRKEEILKFSNILEKNLSLSQVYTSKNAIIGSMIHMQCNRILGLNKDNEEKSNAFMLHTLHSLKFHMMKIETKLF
ncbi:lantibiotic dehydratase [Silvanigrella sp.]|uniref:lantibiotic dehydratase n=1 Tax=Silvanigrella sp. TaxID=2024976 RepID=UPI0037CB2C18